MGTGNTVVVNFKASPRLKEIIEKHASKKKISVSEYAREAVLFDMITSGNIEAMKYVASDLGEKFTKTVRNLVEKSREEKNVEV